MNVYKCDKLFTVGDAPVGLLRLSLGGELIVKSAYRLRGRCVCTIVRTGENYCGDGDATPDEYGDWALCNPVVVK